MQHTQTHLDGQLLSASSYYLAQEGQIFIDRGWIGPQCLPKHAASTLSCKAHSRNDAGRKTAVMEAILMPTNPVPWGDLQGIYSKHAKKLVLIFPVSKCRDAGGTSMQRGRGKVSLWLLPAAVHD